MAIHWVVDQWTMWEKQSHKPPMTGKGTQFHLSMVKLRMAQMALFYPSFQWWFLMWWFNGVIGILWTELCWKWNMGFKLLHTVGMGSQASKYEDFHGHLMAGSSSGPRGKRYMGFTFDFHRFMMDLWWIYGGLMRIDKDFSQGFFWRLFLGIKRVRWMTRGAWWFSWWNPSDDVDDRCGLLKGGFMGCRFFCIWGCPQVLSWFLFQSMTYRHFFLP